VGGKGKGVSRASWAGCGAGVRDAGYLGTEWRGSRGGELVGQLGADGGQDSAGGRAPAEGGGRSQPPQEHWRTGRGGAMQIDSVPQPARSHNKGSKFFLAK
jgi:hypothetical protein